MKVKTVFRFVGICLLMAAVFACASGGGSRGERGLTVEDNAKADIEVFPQLGHTRYVNSVAFSPDGRQVLSGGDNVKLWDVATAKEIRTFTGHSDYVNSVAFSPDGKQVISGSGDMYSSNDDNTVRQWDVATGREIRIFTGHTKQINSVAFSPDGRQILSGSNDETVKLWNAVTGEEIRTFTGPTEPVNSVAFSPDGKYILSGDGFTFTTGGTKTVRLWSVETGQLIRTLRGYRMAVMSVVFSPDGRQILSGSRDNTIKLWDTETGNEIRTFSGHTGAVTSVAFSSDGKQILSCTGYPEYSIKLWDAATGREIRTFSGHTSWVNSVAFSPDGRQVLSCSNDKTIKLWDMETGNEIKIFTGYTDGGYSVAFSPDGRQIISGGSIIKLWDAATGKVIRNFSEGGGHVTFSPDGNQVLSTSFNDYTFKLWDVATGREIRTFSGHRNPVNYIVFSPDGKQILSGSDDETHKLWDTATGREIRTYNDGGDRMVFSPDGRQVLSVIKIGNLYNRTLKLWDVATGREIRTFSGHTKTIYSVAFSPDGRQVLSGSLDNTIKLWDVETGNEIRTFTGHRNNIMTLCFSPDGKQILSGSWDYTIKLWNATTGEEIRTFAGHRSEVTSVSFSPDGKQIISGSSDGTTRLWDIATGKEIARFISFSGTDNQLTTASRGLTVETATTTSSIDGEWLSITPDGYYQASPRGDRYLNVRVNNTVSGIDAYRSVLYNPDVVEARLRGLPDPKSKGNITIQQAAAIPLPVVTVQSPANFSTTTTGTANLSFTVTSQVQPIKDIKVFVNGFPVGRNEITVTGNQKTVNFNLPVQLDPGRNTIEVVAHNGYTESDRNRPPIEVTYNAPAGQRRTLPNLWILAVGVNRYDNAVIRNLSFTVADATRLIENLKTQESRSYAKVNSLLVTDGTAAEIRQSLKFLDNVGERDTVLIFIAGHGITDRNGKFFFLTRDAVFTDYKTVTDWQGNQMLDEIVVDANRAISGDEITEVLKGQGRRLLMIDACQSGAVNTDRMIHALQESNAYVFSASQGNESSLEHERWGGGHGVFTYSVLNALRGEPKAIAQPGNEVRVLSMSGFVRLEVPRETDGRQNPRLDSRLSADFPLAVIK